MSRPEALRVAREVRERFRESRESFTQQTYFEAVVDALDTPVMRRAAVEGLAAWATDKVDKDSTREGRRHDEGWLFPCEGDIKLGEGERIALAYARLPHIEIALELKRLNAVAAQLAYEAAVREVEWLRPYLERGLTVQEAVSQYRADNPESDEALGA